MIAGTGSANIHAIPHGNGNQRAAGWIPRPAELNYWARTANFMADKVIFTSVAFSALVTLDAMKIKGNSLIQNPLSVISGALLLGSIVALIKNGMNLEQLKNDVIEGLKERAPYIIVAILVRLGLAYLSR